MIYSDVLDIPRPPFLRGGHWKISNLKDITVIVGKNGSGKSLLLLTMLQNAASTLSKVSRCVMTSTSESPIKDRPLRHAAQSLEEERRELFGDKVAPYVVGALVFIVLACFEWWRFLWKVPLNPIIFTIVALASIGLAVWQTLRYRPRLKALRQGIEGEKVVGQFLERLRETGYHVFHDVVGPGFNVDHVLIGPGGVFTIETKTWSKPMNSKPHIFFDGTRILVGSREPDRNPIAQARAQASWVRGLLRESTGKSYSVRPVVAFPGWFIEQPAPRANDIWVLEPKALPSFLENEPQRLAVEDVKLAAFHLSRFIRSVERDKRP